MKIFTGDLLNTTKKTSIFFFMKTVHEAFGNMVKKLLKGDLSQIQPMLGFLIKGVGEEWSGISAAWVCKVDFLISFCLCIGKRKTIKILELLVPLSYCDHVKHNLLRRTVRSCLKNVDGMDECDSAAVITAESTMPSDYMRFVTYIGSLYLQNKEDSPFVDVKKRGQGNGIN